MNKLFFDTETSGFPNDKLPDKHPGQAWIVQIGMILEVNNTIQSQSSFIIKSDGRSINPKAQEIHGISVEVADANGVPEQLIASLLEYYLDYSDLIVGHNISFASRMVRLLLIRNKYLSTLKHMKTIPTVCTMKSATNLCKLPGKHGYKWPKLTELYNFLFQETFPAHDALADIQATYACYKKLIEMGVIDEGS